MISNLYRTVRQGELLVRAREGALGYDLGAPLLSGLYTLSRRGEQCSPTTDVTVASVRVNHRRIYHSHAPIEQWRGSTMCFPTGYPSKMNLHAVRRVVPQGTFSCGVAAIHLVAPYGIPLYKKWRMADRYINSPFSIFNSQFGNQSPIDSPSALACFTSSPSGGTVFSLPATSVSGTGTIWLSCSATI